MSYPPAFHTPRLSFVPINADAHAESIFECRGRADVMKYSINHAPDPSVAVTHAWASKYNHFDDQTPIDPENVSPIGYVISELPASSSPSNGTTNGTVNGTITNSTPTIDTTPTSQNQEGQARIIGTTGLRLSSSPLPNASPSIKRWEIGYGFHPDAWGRGLATETVRGWIRMVSEKGLVDGVPGLNCKPGTGNGGVEIKRALAACTDARNGASMRVLEKCGFVLAGEFLDEQGRRNFEFEFAF
ncbi:hypothetical protein P170DRAFT_468231 [Aspergillus steynii IBT 23096]|uniref:N-acetyltransferase domain-containing protein n=1 Tax=Aspergillus steynii IBT 23096 TaxID=1392250 RepID=A0A2I2FVJ2_9EURO|nr:uncharacterized protein P170DRAFT_468231 [Aspergillus steynii IBT 23096]PLB44586.1 hypothetical protein P170DRAFT_468231 [Aspergillus steynii IBT 23096]